MRHFRQRSEMRRLEPAAGANFFEILDKLREAAANWPI
jgi:hypothetical protein